MVCCVSTLNIKAETGPVKPTKHCGCSLRARDPGKQSEGHATSIQLGHKQGQGNIVIQSFHTASTHASPPSYPFPR